MAGQEPPLARPVGATVLGLERADAVYTLLASCFVVVLVLTNIVGVKLFVLFPGGRPGWLGGGDPLTLTSGIITYPLTFLITDVVSEIWGRKRANYMVVLGFVLSVTMLGIVKLAIALPPSPYWVNKPLGLEQPGEMQMAFRATFYYPGLLLFSSMLAYLTAQLFDVRLYHFWRRVTRGKHLWIRNNGSTTISQLVDTIIVNGIFLHWGLKMEWGTVWGVIVAVYACKVVLALIDTPLIYLVCYLVRRYLGIEAEGWTEVAPLA